MNIIDNVKVNKRVQTREKDITEILRGYSP